LNRYLEALPLARQSAVLKEKLGDLYWNRKNFSDALDTWESALKLNPSPMQKLRLLLTLAEQRASYGPDRVALDFYRRILSDFPGHPRPLEFYQRMLAVAKRLSNAEVIRLCEREIKGLTPAPANNAPANKL
jgi:tetratricopeptide (TPR) repeat protein